LLRTFDRINRPELTHHHRKFLTKSKGGLAGNLVTVLFTDKQGNVWIGTSDGLSKWDGTTITNYTVANGKLPNNYVISIFQDNSDFILIGTSGGLTVTDGTNWVNYPLFDGIEVTSFAETPDLDLLVGTGGYGVIQINPTGGYIQYFDYTCDLCNFIQAIYQDKAGKVWAGTQGGLKSYQDGSFQTYNEFNRTSVTAITPDSWGNLWFGMYNANMMIRYKDSSFEPIPLVSFVYVNWIKTMQEDQHGRLWVTAGWGGLLYYDGAVARQVLDIFEDSFISALTFDKNGELWVGSAGKGVAHFRPLPNN